MSALKLFRPVEPAHLCTPDYVHHVPGRLRLKADVLSRDSRRLARLCAVLGDLPGLRSVMANAVTGSVTIEYDSAVLSPTALNMALPSCGIDLVGAETAGRSASSPQIVEKFLEWVLERAAIALIAAVI